jgi:membrane carboxypeptidase/penicillin-binding protein
VTDEEEENDAKLHDETPSGHAAAVWRVALLRHAESSQVKSVKKKKKPNPFGHTHEAWSKQAIVLATVTSTKSMTGEQYDQHDLKCGVNESSCSRESNGRMESLRPAGPS